MSKDVARALGKLEYGVYVVTIGKGNSGNAFTASWISQVSSEPPMVVMAVHNKHQSTPILNEQRSFVVNLISAEDKAVAQIFYGPAESGYEKLKNAAVTDSPVTGTPILSGVIGYLDCKVVKSIPAGNHSLFLAEVVAAEINEDKPVLSCSESKLRYAG